jgi:pyruvate,water dikinase
MKALWKGFSHPGITWKGTVALNVENFMNLMARGVMTEGGN